MANTVTIEQAAGTAPGSRDEAFIRNALQHANLNALRVALYHETRDQDLKAMSVEEWPVRGGAFIAHSLAAADQERLRDKALRYLTSGAPARTPPTKAEAIDLMEMFSGKPVSAAEADYGFEELAFDPLVRAASWHGGVARERLADFSVGIVGAGVSGIMAAIQLSRLGIAYRIIERNADIGGTWHINDYPESRVDISTFLYQYKFEHNYPWKSYFATQPELKDYLSFIVDKYGVRQHIVLGASLHDARWDESTRRWSMEIRHGDGRTETTSANVIISASGLFSTPNLPDIPGIDTFAGKMFHTTAWDHSYDYRGKRIALIGTGSTGSQLMPGMAEVVDKFTVFQRTPNWVTPAPGYRSQVSAEKRWLLDTMPGYWNWFIYSHYLGEQQIQALQVIDRDWQAKGGRVNQKNHQLAEVLKTFIRSKVGDNDALFDKLVPDYPPVARRLVIDNGWYDALVRDNVELVTEGIERIVPEGIVDRAGRLHAVDLIILGAGFKVSRYLSPVDYRGRDGASLNDLWADDGPRAYMGSVLPGFPNFFMFYGPNSQARAGGFHSWAEIWSRYIVNLIARMLEMGGDSIELKRQVFDDYNARMDQEMKAMLWEEEGKGGYYVNEFGRSGVNMPWTMHQFYEMICAAGIDEYRMTKADPQPTTAGG